MKVHTQAVAVVLSVAVSTRGAVVLDQQHAFTSSIASSTNGDVSQMGQTFTVGAAGVLDHIDVFMFRVGGFFDPTGDPLLRVYSVSGGLPTSSVLATVTIPEVNVPFDNAAFVSFDVSSAGLAVGVGQVLAFSVTATSGVGPYFLPNDQGQSPHYAGGAAVGKFGNNAWTFLSPDQDHSFRTFVSTTTTPTGDFDLDGDVDGADFLRWQRGGSPNPNSPGDLAIWRSNFGLGAATPVDVPVPEPTTWALMLCAAACFFVRSPCFHQSGSERTA